MRFVRIDRKGSKFGVLIAGLKPAKISPKKVDDVEKQAQTRVRHKIILPKTTPQDDERQNIIPVKDYLVSFPESALP